jgi:3-hydroxyacyl-[acyl-carrier-protein] dehydratase
MPIVHLKIPSESGQTESTDTNSGCLTPTYRNSRFSYSLIRDSFACHRYPFLLVDRILEWEYGKYAVGYKCVTINDNFFPGHFPQRAIMPGVLQVEAMAQLGGIVMLDPADAGSQKNFFFGGVDNLRWRKPVVPGDVLMMRVDVTKFNKRFGICKMGAKAFVGEDLVCEADLTLVMGN